MRPRKTLLQEIASVKSLNLAWISLNKSRKESKGLSNVTIKEFEDNLRNNLKIISSELLDGSFRFSDVKGVTIKKKPVPVSPGSEDLASATKNLRPLRIPEIKDRIVHKSLAIKLEQLLSKKYNLRNDCSFAYIKGEKEGKKGRNVQDAILKMLYYYDQGYKTILEVDIIKFFDNVDKAKLLKDISSRLRDTSIDDLLSKAISQEIGNIGEMGEKIYEEYFKESEDGIPQGNALSPLLANIYLSEFDKRTIQEQLKMIRYADDFIVMCRDRNEGIGAFAIAKEELEGKLGLRLHPFEDGSPKQSRVLDPRQTKFSFLSVRFDGQRCTIDESKLKSFKEKLESLSSPELLRIKFPKEKPSLLQALTRIKNMVDGWMAAFTFLDLETQIDDIDNRISVCLKQLFENFELGLHKKDLELLSFKNKSNKVLAVTRKTRLTLGIPMYSDFYKRSKRGVPSLIDRSRLM